MLVVALGPRREVASLEATAIAPGGCRGNTAGARGAGLLPRRHCPQAGRTRARQSGPRRAGLPDALRATVHWLSLADGRRRRSEDREPRREAGRLTDRLRDFPVAELTVRRVAARAVALRPGGGSGRRPRHQGGHPPGGSVRRHRTGLLRVSCSALPGMTSLPSGLATLYRACATPTASARHWTALVGSCAYGAFRLEAPRYQVAR